MSDIDSAETDSAVAGVVEAANRLRNTVPSSDELESAAGWSAALLYAEKTIGEWRRGVERSALDETAGPVESEHMTLSRKPRRVKRWNHQRILHDIAQAADISPVEALRDLIGSGAVRVEWMITKLRPILTELGVGWDTRDGGVEEIPDDLDSPHVLTVTVGWDVDRARHEEETA